LGFRSPVGGDKNIVYIDAALLDEFTLGVDGNPAQSFANDNVQIFTTAGISRNV
jgi:hypothetical protein